MTEFLISGWNRLDQHCYDFGGDEIIAGIWFHSGNRIIIDYDKKDLDVPYQDKFIYNKIKASVLQFGGKHTEGYLCISSTGLVYAHLFAIDENNKNGLEFLNEFRSRIERIDIAYMRDGSFLVMTSNGNAFAPITCYIIRIMLDPKENYEKIKIKCEPFTSFHLNSALFTNPDHLNYVHIDHLKFIVRECPDAALVVASGTQGSIIECWELKEKPIEVHSVFKNLYPSKAEQIITEKRWEFVSNAISTAFVTSISTPNSLLFEINPLSSYIMVAFSDHSIKSYYRENFQPLNMIDLKAALKIDLSSNTSLGQYFTQEEIDEKITIVRDIQITWSSCALVAIDCYSQIHLFRLPPMIEPFGPMSINYAQLMLEYALISGNDIWDILINIKPQFVETLCDKVAESFIGHCHPQYLQQKWLDKVLQMKAALFRCTNLSLASCKSGDFYAMKMLNAISETIKRLIRAREYHENEGPAEKLSYLIQTKPTTDFQQFLNIDKILFKLDSKDFCVEATIQHSFQYLLQWVCDLSLYLLASIPQQCHQSQFRVPGVSLFKKLFSNLILNNRKLSF